MKLTRKLAKELSIEKWEWLYHHPLKTDDNLPKNLLKKLKFYRAGCALCSLYDKYHDSFSCPKCPIQKADKCCYIFGSWYKLYKDEVFSNKFRKFYAGLILNTIKNWKV